MNLSNNVQYIKKNIPNSIDAECSIIGGLILDNETWMIIENIINYDDFYQTNNRIIFRHIQKMLQQDIHFDIITLSDSLSNEKLLDKIGGLHYLANITKNTPSTNNIVAYAKIVKERAQMRLLLKSINDIANMVYMPDGKQIYEILDIAEQKILSIAANQINDSRVKPVNEIIPKVIKKIDLLMDAKDGITGVSTGFNDLDELTSGLHSGNLIIIAGRPSMGKTTLAINLAENASKNSEKPVLMFSLEMSSEDLVLRMISSLGCIEQNLLRNGRLQDKDWVKIMKAMEILSEQFNMLIDDSAVISPTEMRYRARKLYKENNGLKMIIVDYLQLMKISGYENNRTQEVSEISRSLKSLAKELNIPIIALSQLNRGVDDRSDKRPIMSDLRDSGAIEQDADLILFVYRDEVYYKNNENNKGLGEIIIGKQRNGPIGTIKVQFEGSFCRFANLTCEQNIPI